MYMCIYVATNSHVPRECRDAYAVCASHIYGAYEKLGILCVSHELHTIHVFLMSHEIYVRHDLVRAARVCHVCGVVVSQTICAS